MYYFVPLKHVAIGIGALLIAGRLPGVLNPQRFRDFARKFPRSVPWGIAFLTISAVWCSIIVSGASEEGMVIRKEIVYAFIWGIYAGLIFLKFDFLAVRGLAIVLMLIAKVIVDSANQLETPWRLVMTVLAYIWAIASMWFTVSPWRMRDLLDWVTATDARTRLKCGIGCAVGVLLITLGLFAY